MRTRISCTALGRVTDEQGNVALCVVRNNSSSGARLRPLGGSLMSGPSARTYLVRQFHASAFEHPRELRFVVPTPHVDAVFQWFRTRRMRETGMHRILCETLMDNMHALGLSDTRQITERLRMPAIRFDGSTPRPVLVRDTAYLVEVFDLHIPPHVMAKLKAASQTGRPALTFMSPAEITRRAAPGGDVSSLAPLLLQDAPA